MENREHQYYKEHKGLKHGAFRGQKDGNEANDKFAKRDDCFPVVGALSVAIVEEAVSLFYSQIAEVVSLSMKKVAREKRDSK